VVAERVSADLRSDGVFGLPDPRSRPIDEILDRERPAPAPRDVPCLSDGVMMVVPPRCQFEPAPSEFRTPTVGRVPIPRLESPRDWPELIPCRPGVTIARVEVDPAGRRPIINGEEVPRLDGPTPEREETPLCDRGVERPTARPLVEAADDRLIPAAGRVARRPAAERLD
jgi:hypothetical protein